VSQYDAPNVAADDERGRAGLLKVESGFGDGEGQRLSFTIQSSLH
jgi:hypothetical protein